MSDALLQEIKERRQHAIDEWADIRAEAKIDMRHVAGDPWEPDDRKDRKASGRPCLALDELGQYFNQVINDVRANPRGMKFSPNGQGATDKTAAFYADKAREIEYRSRAQIAYTTAFQNTIHRSYGFCRVNTKFASDRSFDQDLWIESFPNPDMVLPDPDALSPDSSDMQYCFVYETWSTSEFKRKFPKAKITDFASFNDIPQWVSGDNLVVAEYWTIKRTPRTLLLVQPPAMQAPGAFRPGPPPRPIEIFEDDYAKQKPQAGAHVIRDRKVDYPSVCQYLTNGVEVLKETAWAGKYIPIASCYGNVLYVDEGAGAKRKMLSMTRLARDPYMLYCYYRSCEAELVGMTPKFPYFVYEGQLSAEEQGNLAKSLHAPVAVIKVKPMIDGATGQVLPFPQRQPYEPPIQALEVGAEAARRAIQAAMGSSFLPTQAQRHNEKSGTALKRIEETSAKGSFHFVDHYDDMIRHVGVMVEDLMDKIYDTAREVGVREANDSAKMIVINDPQQPDSQSTKGDHLVTISTGPSFDSQRDVVTDFIDTFISSPLLGTLPPPQMHKVIAQAIRMKNMGVGGDELADLIDPPQTKPGEKPNPQQLQQQLQDMGGQLQELTQAAAGMKQALETEQAKQQAQVQVKTLDTQSRERIAAADRAAKIEIARITAGKQTADLALEAEEEALALGRTHAHDTALQGRDHAHDVALAAQQHQQALEAGQQSHDQTLEAGQQGHENAMQQTEQAAALAPEPAAGA